MKTRPRERRGRSSCHDFCGFPRKPTRSDTRFETTGPIRASCPFCMVLLWYPYIFSSKHASEHLRTRFPDSP